MSTPTESREITFAQAINEAMHEEMDRDHSVIVMGEDVAAFGGVYKLTQGLLARFGPEQVWDTPISEPSLVGLGRRSRGYRIAANRRSDVRRFSGLGHGSNCEPSGQDSLHVGRGTPGSAGDSNHDGRWKAGGCATLANAQRVARAHSWFEGGGSLHAVRCERPAQNRNSGQQSGDCF